MNPEEGQQYSCIGKNWNKINRELEKLYSSFLRSQTHSVCRSLSAGVGSASVCFHSFCMQNICCQSADPKYSADLHRLCTFVVCTCQLVMLIARIKVWFTTCDRLSYDALPKLLSLLLSFNTKMVCHAENFNQGRHVLGPWTIRENGYFYSKAYEFLCIRQA